MGNIVLKSCMLQNGGFSGLVGVGNSVGNTVLKWTDGLGFLPTQNRSFNNGVKKDTGIHKQGNRREKVKIPTSVSPK